MTTQSTLAQPHSEDYSRIEPLPDPPREPDAVRRKSLSTLDNTLGPHFVAFSDVLITGLIYVLIDEDDARELAPDFIFARQVGDPERVIRRNGYVISEAGKPPDLVLEVGSRSTGRRNYTVKRAGYAALGIGEYWRFDPSGGDYHDRHLAGDTLVDGEYVPVEIAVEPDGRRWGYSEVLELELWWEEGTLRFQDPANRQFLLTPEEERAARKLPRLVPELRKLAWPSWKRN
ncbi:MAG: Uma2 family endonuclease [Chloroflexi bacterium]|nr:Uma2 family endonuclease [Chloroflexota bacterium]